MITDFFSTLFDPEISFLRYALFVGLIGSIPLGITGSFVISRNISSIAGALAHAVLGGVGFALYAQRVLEWTFCTPFLGALAGALIAALLIYFTSLYAKEKEDTAISAVWALGMSAGLLFIAATPGNVDLQGYLFGNILLVTEHDLMLTAILSAAVTLLTMIFFRPLQAMLFDSEFSKLRNINVNLLYLLLLLLIALTVVLMVNVAGIILLIALLSLPAATAKCFVRHLTSMMVLASLLSMAEIGLGLFAGYIWDMPIGPLAVILAVILYVASLLKKHISNFLRRKNVQVTDAE